MEENVLPLKCGTGSKGGLCCLIWNFCLAVMRRVTHDVVAADRLHDLGVHVGDNNVKRWMKMRPSVMMAGRMGLKRVAFEMPWL